MNDENIINLFICELYIKIIQINARSIVGGTVWFLLVLFFLNRPPQGWGSNFGNLSSGVF